MEQDEKEEIMCEVGKGLINHCTKQVPHPPMFNCTHTHTHTHTLSLSETTIQESVTVS